MSGVAYQGDEGAFGHEVAQKVSQNGHGSVGCRTFADVVQAVERRWVELGVLPVHNTIAGEVSEAVRLIDGSGLRVIDEITLPIRQCLLVLPSATLDDVREVRSHPVALAQCRLFLELHPRMSPIAWWDTGGAAHDVAGLGDNGVAAVASAFAAERWGLTVARQGIQDEPENETRFAVVGRG